MAVEVWAMRTPETGTIERLAERSEREGWDGIRLTDSQNLVGDPFVAAALAARVTDRLKLGTGVSNLHTRHPAALATVAATVHEESGGRFTLGLGRGDTALFHLGLSPMKVDPFRARLDELQRYLSGEVVDQNGTDSRLGWLDRAKQSKVHVDIAASGSRVITLAAQLADGIVFAVGADPDRLAWAVNLAKTEAAKAGRAPDELKLGAYVNVGCHPDREVARELISGGVAAFAHFSAMPGSKGDGLAEEDRGVVAEVGRTYNSNEHLSNKAQHTTALDADFVDRFAIVGSPDDCVAKAAGLVALGLSQLVLIGTTYQADRDAARTSAQLITNEFIPGLRAAVASS